VVEREKNGKWVKGTSPNPSGKSKSDVKVEVELKQLARKHTKESINRVVEIMRDRDAPHTATLAAVTILLDRGYGKPSQHIEAIVKERPDIALDEVARMMLFAMRDAEERQIEDKSVINVKLLKDDKSPHIELVDGK